MINDRSGSAPVLANGSSESTSTTLRVVPERANDSVRVSVVMPALNEEPNLEHILPRLPDGIHELVLVDGGSSDRTVQAAMKLYPRTRVVHQEGRGKGSALEQGAAAAEGDIVVTIDADGSTDPAEIPRFVEVLCTGADYAKGTRFIQGAGSDDLTRLRSLGNWGLTRLVNYLFGTRYSDLCYGFNAFWTRHRHILRDVPGFEVETAMNVRAAKIGLEVVEVASMERCRVHGTSNLNTFRDGWRVLKTIFRERFASKASREELYEALHTRVGDSSAAVLGVEERVSAAEHS